MWKLASSMAIEGWEMWAEMWVVVWGGVGRCGEVWEGVEML